MITQSLMLRDRVGTLVAICASSSDLVEAALAQPAGLPQRVVLMAPLPGGLAVRLQGIEGATVLHALPGKQAGQSDLISYSLPGMFSLGDPLPALRALMPGLQVIEHSTVDRVGSADLAEMLKDLPLPVQIIIDLPGAEGDVIDALAVAGVLDRATGLELRCGIEPFFAGAEAADALAKRLTARDFRLDHTDESDPDWPVLKFLSDPMAKANRQLKAERDAALAERDAARAEAETSLRAHNATLAERDALRVATQQIDNALEAERAALAAAQAEHDLAKAEAEAILRARDEALAERDAELGGLRLAMQQVRGALQTERAVIATVQAERDAARAEAEATLHGRDSALAERDAELGEMRAAMQQVRGALQTERAAIATVQAERDAARAEAEATLNARDSALAERDAELAGLRVALQQVRGALQAERAVLATAQAERDTTLAERDAELGELRVALKQTGVSLESERAALTAVQAERDAARAEAEQRRVELGRAETELGTLRDFSAQVRAALEAERAARAEAQTDRDTLRAEKAARDQNLAQKAAALSASEQALGAARGDLAVALRLQVLAQGDLRDLQDRFTEVERQRRLQADLLKKLAPRLLIAAEQLTHMIARPPSDSHEAGLPEVIGTQKKKSKKHGKSKKGKRP